MAMMFRYKVRHTRPGLVLLLVVLLGDSQTAFITDSRTIHEPNEKTHLQTQLIPQDPDYPQQQSSLTTLELEKAWDMTTGSNNIVVAVIDDAIDVNHPDLRDNMGAGWDFVDGDNDPSPGICNANGKSGLEAHGTLVAGVIGAVANNNVGISGINWNVTIMPLRIGCDFRSDREFLAIKYAIDNGADIINLSYGAPVTSAFIQNNLENIKQLLINAQNEVLVVISAGNFHVSNDDVAMYPASMKLDNVIIVAASDNKRQLTPWSQYGATSVDVAAPGVDIRSTRVNSNADNSEYGYVSGTSFSAALVSGVAALLKAKSLEDGGNEIAPADLKAILQASASKLSDQKAVLKTDGTVNAANALSILHFPRPVLTIEAIDYDDSTEITDSTSYQNGLLDPNESGLLNIRVKNLWEDVLDATVTLVSTDNSVSVVAGVKNQSYWPKGEAKRFAFEINTGMFSGQRSFSFQLILQATGMSGSRNIIRDFFLNTGVLANLKAENGIIQKNRFDDYQYFHFNLPYGSEKVAVELSYPNNDSRDMGLLASFDKKPLIHFAKYNNSPYWYSADAKSDMSTGFERIDLEVPAGQAVSGHGPTVLNVLVFNAPADAVSTKSAVNKSFTIKACGLSQNDGNTPPIVNAGRDQTVTAGDTVTLTAIVADNDGEITRQWWEALDGTPLLSVDGRQLTFIAPPTGEARFTYTAIDNGCKLSRDTVVVKIRNEVGEIPGFQINPSNVSIAQNSTLDLIVTASNGSQIIDDIDLTSRIDGLRFVKNNNRLRGNRLIWENVGPVGLNKIRFSATILGETKNSFILVDVVPRGKNNRGGGCSSVEHSNFDPLFLIYLLLSFYFLKKNPVNALKPGYNPIKT